MTKNMDFRFCHCEEADRLTRQSSWWLFWIASQARNDGDAE